MLVGGGLAAGQAAPLTRPVVARVAGRAVPGRTYDRAVQKVRLRRLPVTSPPIPAGGGRIQSPAGELAQIVNGGTYRFLAYLEFRPDAARPRGNHYHAHKTETLYVISGRLRAVFRDLDSGERTELTIEAGDAVTVEPRCAHVYFALEHSQAVELADTPYDPGDTHPCDVVGGG